MKRAGFLGALLLVALLWGATLRNPEAPITPLARAPGGVLVVLVHGPHTGGGGPRLDVLEAALAPGRDWESALATGERRPPAGAPRLGPTLRAAGVRTVAIGPAAARLLDTSESGGFPDRYLQGGVCVVAEASDWAGFPPDPTTAVLTLPAEVGADEAFVPVILTAPGARGRPASPSTRVPGLVAATDLPATIAALCGVEVRIGAGRPVGWIGDDAGGLERRAVAWRDHDALLEMRWVVPWGMALLLVWGAVRRQPRAWFLAAALPAGLLAAPLAAWGCAWLVAQAVGGYLAAPLANPVATYGLALGIAWGIATRGPGSSLPRIAWVTALFCAGDALLGFPLQVRSPLGYGLAEGSRFFGVGNETAGAWIGAALCVGVCGRRGAGAALLAGAALAIGSPSLGANAGCGIAAGGALVVLGASGLAPGRRAVALGTGFLALCLLVLGMARRDAGRPDVARTHVGQAVASARTQGAGALARIAWRKLGTNGWLLTHSPWTVLLLAEGAALWTVRRRLGGVGKGIEPLLAGAGLALALNDSGVLAAALCGVFVPVAGTETKDDPPTADAVGGSG